MPITNVSGCAKRPEQGKPSLGAKCPQCTHRFVCTHAEAVMKTTQEINERCTDQALGGAYYEMQCIHFYPEDGVNCSVPGL